MSLARGTALPIDEELSLVVRAAWLYFAGGLTQAEVAARLNVPSLKAHRMIARATRDGLIRVFVEGSIAECIRLEESLSGRYGLSFCQVAPDLDEGDMPLKALSLAGASFVRNTLERGDDAIIGVGHGRTLAGVVEHLPRVDATGVRFVSLLGGLTRKFSANPFDVIHRLAERTGAEAYLLPVPSFANSASDKDVFLQQIGIAEVMALARQATLLLVGIGEAAENGFLASFGMIAPDEQNDLLRSGACGEVLGHFFDAGGRPIETALSGRAIAPSLEDLKGRRTIAIAGGSGKVAAIRAVLGSGLLSGLITDEVTARALSDATQSPPPINKKNGRTPQGTGKKRNKE